MERANPSNLDRVFKALGHVTRRRILQLLAQSPRYPYELSKILDLNRRVVLKHLEALEEAGLVTHESASSSIGPDRTYYRLSVSFGLSTTILPNSFLIRFIRPSDRILRQVVPSIRPDVEAVRSLLIELEQINKRIEEIDAERVRLADLRGQIISRIDEIMEQCNWDEATRKKVRTLLDPIRVEVDRDRPDPFVSWNKTVREIIKLFEKFMTMEEIEVEPPE